MVMMLLSTSLLVRPNEHSRAGHGQRPEAIDYALLYVFGHAGAGNGGAEDNGLGKNARDQELFVADAWHVDCTAKHVGKQQNEHDRRHGGEHQDQ